MAKRLNEGNLDEAKKLAYQAQKLHGPYTFMDLGDRPQRVLDDIRKLEVKTGKSGLPDPDPFGKDNFNEGAKEKKIQRNLCREPSKTRKKPRRST